MFLRPEKPRGASEAARSSFPSPLKSALTIWPGKPRARRKRRQDGVGKRAVSFAQQDTDVERSLAGDRNIGFSIAIEVTKNDGVSRSGNGGGLQQTRHLLSPSAQPSLVVADQQQIGNSHCR